MFDKEIVCCFTGHREIPPERRGQITELLVSAVDKLVERGCLCFMTGGALGFDTLAAEAVLSARKRNPQIRLTLVLPCMTQAKGWSAADAAVYDEIKSECDSTVYTSEEYTRGCMFRRNRYLVDNSGICVAYMTVDKGGTAYTVRYALKKRLEVINIAQNVGTEM